MISVLKVLCWLSALGFTGCLIPVPMIPLNLPAHGHTYRIHDQDNRPVADEGLLIIHTKYEDISSRIDCYPIRNGKATAPVAFDVRGTLVPMFGDFSLYVPTFFICSSNADYAYVYPLVPGYASLEDLDSRKIYGVRPRPKVLGMFRCTPLEEYAMLESIKYSYQDPYGDSHNEQQALRILHFIRERQKVVAVIPSDRSQAPNENKNEYVKKTKAQIAVRSARWKAQQRVEDILWLVEHAIPTGSSKSHVRELLGEPLPSACVCSNCYYYIDAAKDSAYSFKLVMDSSSKVKDFTASTNVRWRKLEQDAGEYLLVPNLIEELHEELLRHFPVRAEKPEMSLTEKQARARARRWRPEYVYKLPYAEAKEYIEKHRTAAQLKRLTIYGRLSDLRQDGECWYASYDNGTRGSYTAVFDLRTRKLVLLKINTWVGGV